MEAYSKMKLFLLGLHLIYVRVGCAFHSPEITIHATIYGVREAMVELLEWPLAMQEGSSSIPAHPVCFFRSMLGYMGER